MWYGIDCPDRTELLAALDGATGSVRGFLMRRHIAGCAGCRDRLAALSGIEDVLFQHFARESSRGGAQCPDCDDLAAFGEGSLTDGDRDRVGAHISHCERCGSRAEVLRSWTENREGSFPRAPRQVVRRAREMAGPKPGARWRLAAYPAAAVAAVGLGLLLVPRSVLHVPKPGAQFEPGRPSAAREGGGGVLNGTIGVRAGQPVPVAFRYRLHGSPEVREVAPSLAIPNLSAQDNYALRIKPSHGGWVYVFQADSGGNLDQLFPSARFRTAQNPVQAGSDYLIPSDRLWFYLDRTEGVDRIFVAFSSVRREKWEQLWRDSHNRSDSPAGKQLMAELAALPGDAGAAGEGDRCTKFEFKH